PAVLGLVADGPPAGVVAVLLAALRVAPGGLDVAVGSGRDPDVGPGRRDRQGGDPAGRLPGAHPTAGRGSVREPPPRAPPAGGPLRVAHVPEPRLPRRDERVGLARVGAAGVAPAESPAPAPGLAAAPTLFGPRGRRHASCPLRFSCPFAVLPP